MSERGNELSIEAKEGIVSVWIEGIYVNGEVDNIDSSLVKGVLEYYGAKFESQEALSSLGKYTNKAKREGLDLVWGKERIDAYRKWAKEYIEKYEETNPPLPALKDSGIKTSGMVQFLGELTSFAAGALSFEEFKTYTEARALNGKLWKEGRKDERVRVKVPTDDEPILLSSFPPGFASDALKHLQETKPVSK